MQRNYLPRVPCVTTKNGIRAVKPELLPRIITKALDVSQSTLKDYQVESYADLVGMFLQLEEEYGLQPSEDGMGLSIGPKSKHSPKLAYVFREWGLKKAPYTSGVVARCI